MNKKYFENLFFEGKFVNLKPGPASAPQGAGEGPKPKTPEDRQADFEHKLTHFQDYADKFANSRFKSVNERGKIMQQTAKMLKNKLDEYTKNRDKMREDVKHNTLLKLDQHLQSRIDYLNSQDVLRKKQIQIPERQVTATPASAVAPAQKPGAKPAVKPASAVSRPETIETKNADLSAEVDHKINFLQKYLDTKRGNHSHSIAMRFSPEYKNAYNALQKAKQEKTSADSTTNQQEKNNRLTSLNKQIDEQAKKGNIQIPPYAKPKSPTENAPSPVAGKPSSGPGTSPEKGGAEATNKPLTAAEKSTDPLPQAPKPDAELSKDVKGKISLLLTKIEKGGMEAFQVLSDKLVGLVNSLNLKPNQEDSSQMFDLPNGYKVSLIKWPASMKKSYLLTNMIFSGPNGKTICFRQGIQWRHSEAPHTSNDIGHVSAEIVKSNAAIPGAIDGIVKHGDKVAFKHNVHERTFKDSLKYLAANAKLDNPIKLRNANITYKNYEFTIEASIKGVGNRVMIYNPRTDSLQTVTYKGSKESGRTEFGSMNQREQKEYDQNIKDNKEKSEAATKRKKYDEGIAKTKGMLNDQYVKKGYVKFDEYHPKTTVDTNKFTIDAPKGKTQVENRERAKLLNMRIDQLLQLNRVTDKVMRITITSKDKKGKEVKKEGMYWPGQKTAYMLDKKGNQTRRRLTYKNGDTINYQMVEPTADLRKSLTTTDRNKQRVPTAEKIKMNDNAGKTVAQLKEFKKLGGKATDLPKSVQKIAVPLLAKGNNVSKADMLKLKPDQLKTLMDETANAIKKKKYQKLSQ